MLLVAVGFVLTMIELFTYADDGFRFTRVAISLSFLIATIIYTIIGYRHDGFLYIRILVGIRIIGVILNILAVMLLATAGIRWWVYAYLIVILAGLIAFYLTLDKPDIAKKIIIGLVIVAVIYSLARNFIIGHTVVEAFRPVLFEYILAVVYWSKQDRGSIAADPE
jgi:hypothetical protein